jgi:hypothetical protein
MFERISCALLITLVLVCPAAAQDPPGETARRAASEDAVVTRIFRVEHADVRDIARVISIFGGRVQPEPDLGVIGWTGSESVLPAVEAAITNLDVAPVPEPNVQLTVDFLMASRSGGVSSVPADLEGVAAQLEQVFGYDTVRLLETTAMRVRHGSRGEINGVLPERLSGDREARYEFAFNRLLVTEDEDGRAIRIDTLRASVQAPQVAMVDGQPTVHWVDNGIRTDIDLREGRKAVIGKTAVEGGPETVFVVVTATIVQ